MDRVIKRDKKQELFEEDKIKIALRKANSEVAKKHRLTEDEITEVAVYIKNVDKKVLGVEAINDIIVNKLVALNKPEVLTKFIEYRHTHKLRLEANTTDNAIFELLGGTSEYWNKENSNKNAKVVTTQRDYIAGIASTDISKRLLLPQDIVKAHEDGIIHFHDMDYFAQNALNNCCLINLFDMLYWGTMINNIMIERPRRVLTASTIATQIIAAVTSSQYGGATITLSHLAPFVRYSYILYIKEGLEFFERKSKYKIDRLEKWLESVGSAMIYSDEFRKKHKEVVNYADIKIKQEVNAAVQTFNYQVNSMSTTNGQSPFISVNMYLGEDPEYTREVAILIEEFLHQRIKGMKNKNGNYIAQTFPKLLYVLEEQNIYEGSEYYYLTQLAAECTAKRMVPDYISEKIMKEQKDGNCFPCMGCRSFLSPYKSEKNLANNGNFKKNQYQFYGRFNKGVVTISLPDVALSSKGNMEEFWKIFDERLELCHRALKCRYERLKGKTSDMAPILWQDGAFARLAPGEKIDPLLTGGYSSISLGYGGLYECVKYMTGESHTAGGKEFGLEVMRYMNKKCDDWNAEENLGYGIYGTPMESTTYKFAKALKKRFGEDVFVKLDGEDRNYITNSYHVPVFEQITAFDKLKFEAEFQSLSTGGAISYIEAPNLQKNVGAVMNIIKFIYNNIMYAEMNLKLDTCLKCNYEGQMPMQEYAHKKYKFVCPNCGNEDPTFMINTRRTCGYLGSFGYNDGRLGDIHDRVEHIDNFVCKECE